MRISEVQELAKRNHRNPKTGKAMKIPPSKLLSFKISQELKYMVK
ncbi:hypothetical protein MC28_G304 (plasmid) [Bacillus thuringiensis MC28]|nr:hypothetical protein MC28_G304 [Bacillus thuringiensis MC28]